MGGPGYGCIMSEQTTTDPLVVHAAAASRYEIFVDGERSGFAEYELRDGVITFFHTVTDPAKRGRGYAAIVVEHALDAARAAGYRVVPRCWYVAQFIDQHPEYSDLLG